MQQYADNMPYIYRRLHCKGFTLIEVLVAMVLLSITGILIIQLFADNLKTISVSGDYSVAAERAQVIMREILDDENLSETSWSEATDDGYRIDVNIIDIMKNKTDNLPLRLMEIDLAIRWKAGLKEKKLQLQTAKIMDKFTTGKGPVPGR